MNILLECRFMQTALGHAPCTLTDEELRSDFKDFQTALLDLLDGSGGYRTIDFMLQDALCILEHIFPAKKITHYCACSFYGPGPICAPASRKTTNG